MKKASLNEGRKRDFIPLIMGFLLLAGIAVVAMFRLNRVPSLWKDYPVNVDVVFIGLYVVWLLLESRISKKDVKTEGKRTADFATCQIYGFGQALTFLSALWFIPIWRSPGVPHFIGICLFILAVCYRLWAIHTLGPFYSHRVRIVTEHQIVDSGPYRFTRHPAYAGMIVANVGICIYFFNWVTLCAFLFVLLPAIILRILIEERALLGIKGYARFAEKRKRLFPAVW